MAVETLQHVRISKTALRSQSPSEYDVIVQKTEAFARLSDVDHMAAHDERMQTRDDLVALFRKAAGTDCILDSDDDDYVYGHVWVPLPPRD